MDSQRIFSLKEAQQMLPQLRAMLNLAKDELKERAEIVRSASQTYEQIGQVLASLKRGDDEVSEVSELRKHRHDFQQAIEKLSGAQNQYVECLNIWVDRISSQGVILRDIESGLLDFPARDGHFEYLLCWRQEEQEITHWHMDNDGFAGRRPLAVLSEYI